MTGDLDLNGNEVQGALLTADGPGGQNCIGEDVILRSAKDITAHQFLYPSSGAEPTIGGANIATDDTLAADGYTRDHQAETITEDWIWDNNTVDVRQPVSGTWLNMQDGVGADLYRLRHDSDGNFAIGYYDGVWKASLTVDTAGDVTLKKGVSFPNTDILLTRQGGQSIVKSGAGGLEIESTTGDLYLATSAGDDEIYIRPNNDNCIRCSHASFFVWKDTTINADLTVDGNFTVAGDFTTEGELGGATMSGPVCGCKVTWAGNGSMTLSDRSPGAAGWTVDSSLDAVEFDNISTTNYVAAVTTHYPHTSGHNIAELHIFAKEQGYIRIRRGNNSPAGCSGDLIVVRHE
jgi:hypothetical protein